MNQERKLAGRRIRYPVEVDATVYRSGGRKTLAKLTDFSDQGCRIESSSQFYVGEKLEIAMPRMGKVKAQVRWTAAGSAGAKFLIESDF